MEPAQEIPGEKLTLDFSGLKEALTEVNKALVVQMQEALKPVVPANGKGLVMAPEKTKKLVESLRACSTSDNWKLAEQWTVAIPNYRIYEIRAAMRDYIYTTEILKNEQGDVANIPYVMDFDFEQLGAVGNAIAATVPEASFIGSVTTTLYETAKYADLSYYLLERFDSNLLDQVNQAFAIAAIRSEDAKIMALVEALTSTNFAGNVTRLTGAAYFYSSNISKALKLLMMAGKNVSPQECVLYLTPSAYGALLEEMMASQVLAYVTPSMITQGLIEQLFGVKIVVGGYRPSQQRTNQATGTVDLVYLMRGKRAIALAPKRDILVETQKQVATRKLRIVASHTFGVKILDAKEIVRIWTSRVAK